VNRVAQRDDKKVADKDSAGKWKLREDPLILTRVTSSLKSKIITALEKYSLTYHPNVDLCFPAIGS
jgi:hypothetical protein